MLVQARPTRPWRSSSQDVIGAETFCGGRGALRHRAGDRDRLPRRGRPASCARPRSTTAPRPGSMAFGQGLAVPLVQIVRAFGAVANGGVPLTPHFLVYRGDEQVEWPAGGARSSRRGPSAQEVDMMRGVMAEGSRHLRAGGGLRLCGQDGHGRAGRRGRGLPRGAPTSRRCAPSPTPRPPELLASTLASTTPPTSRPGPPASPSGRSRSRRWASWA